MMLEYGRRPVFIFTYQFNTYLKGTYTGSSGMLKNYSDAKLSTQKGDFHSITRDDKTKIFTF